jgi:hypothetical protein
MIDASMNSGYRLRLLYKVCEIMGGEPGWRNLASVAVYIYGIADVKNGMLALVA